MDRTDTPQDPSQINPSTAASTDPLAQLDRLAELAEEAANNPHTSAPLRELMPLLVAIVRQQAEVLALLGA